MTVSSQNELSNVLPKLWKILYVSHSLITGDIIKVDMQYAYNQPAGSFASFKVTPCMVPLCVYP